MNGQPRVRVAGLIGVVQYTEPGTTAPDPESAWEMVREAIKRGVMLFAPVGVAGCAVRINPPLTITRDMLRKVSACWKT